MCALLMRRPQWLLQKWGIVTPPVRRQLHDNGKYSPLLGTNMTEKQKEYEEQ